MRASGGGGGGLIIVNPESLRRCAATFRGACEDATALSNGLTGFAMPAMPDGWEALVRGELSSTATTLEDTVRVLDTSSVELDRRALWAEIADELAAGVALTGPQYQAFLRYLKDGSMLRYAEPWQARLAGEWVGTTYASRFRDPAKLEELATILRGNQQDDDFDLFAAGFIENFGAKNLADIPRVIQAMEYARPIALTIGGDPQAWLIDRNLANDIYRSGFHMHQEPLDLLAAFSMALATATYSGQLSRQTEHDIAYDEDAWAVAQLLHTGTFGTDFLVDCFNSKVVDRVVQESRQLTPREYYALGFLGKDGEGGPGLPLDPKVLVLEALGRNSEAAAAAFAQRIAIDPSELGPDAFVQDDAELKTPLQLLYRYGDFEDGGQSLVRAWHVGVDGLLAGNVDMRSDLFADRQATAADLTEQMASEVIQDLRDPRLGDLETRPALAEVIRDHYVEDLHLSAIQPNVPLDFDKDADGILGASSHDGIALSHLQTVALLDELFDHEDARQNVLDGVAAYQTELVRDNTGPAGVADRTWLGQLGNFNGLLVAANEADLVGDAEAAVARQEAVLKTIGAVSDLLPLSKTAGWIAGQGLDLAHETITGGGQVEAAHQQGYDFQQFTLGSTRAAIVDGYFEHGLIGTEAQIDAEVAALRAADTPGWQPTEFIQNGKLIPYAEMNADQRMTFDYWVQSSDLVERVDPHVQDVKVDMLFTRP